MMIKNKFVRYFYTALFILAIISDKAIAAAEESVVVYTSVDQVFSEPILKQFEKKTGISVKAIYDVEASKTVGLEKRLIAEKSRPQADIFWNSEYLRTLRLQQAGVLTPFTSEQVSSLPPDYISASGYWAGFGIRARVFVVNTEIVSSNEMPQKLEDLTEPKWKGKTAVAKPYFGTTSTHFTALCVKWGEKKYIEFLKALKKNEVAILPGNSNVRDAVVQGRYAFGLTDTDDVNVSLQEKKPVKMIYPDQKSDGAFAIFHTVAKIKEAPNPDNAQKLIDYLLSKDVESELIKSGAVQISVHSDLNNKDNPKLWHIVSEDILNALKPSSELIRQHLE